MKNPAIDDRSMAGFSIVASSAGNQERSDDGEGQDGDHAEGKAAPIRIKGQEHRVLQKP
jgi:hypothetical protein